MTEVVLEIPLRTPSGNQLSGYHWRKRHRMKRDWYYCLLAAMRTAGVDPKPYALAFDVTIERHAARALDADNAVSGCKALIDAMVLAGLLVDDSPRYLRSLDVKQVKVPKERERTVIRLKLARPPSGSSSPTSGPAPP